MLDNYADELLDEHPPTLGAEADLQVALDDDTDFVDGMGELHRAAFLMTPPFAPDLADSFDDEAKGGLAGKSFLDILEADLADIFAPPALRLRACHSCVGSSLTQDVGETHKRAGAATETEEASSSDRAIAIFRRALRGGAGAGFESQATIKETTPLAADAAQTQCRAGTAYPADRDSRGQSAGIMVGPPGAALRKLMQTP